MTGIQFAMAVDADFSVSGARFADAHLDNVTLCSGDMNSDGFANIDVIVATLLHHASEFSCGNIYCCAKSLSRKYITLRYADKSVIFSCSMLSLGSRSVDSTLYI